MAFHPDDSVITLLNIDQVRKNAWAVAGKIAKTAEKAGI